MNILTVGIVTMPFLFEGKSRSKQAQSGIDALRENVDSLIVINNNKLREFTETWALRRDSPKQMRYYLQQREVLLW